MGGETEPVRFCCFHLPSRTAAIVITALDILGLLSGSFVGWLLLITAILTLASIILRKVPIVLLVYLVLKVIFSLLLIALGFVAIMGQSTGGVHHGFSGWFSLIFGGASLYLSWVFKEAKVNLESGYQTLQ
eukprot:TRINITY_DN2355_c0_g1_i1.p1 TRINITY_DN2355_c0_g1~~TRINITY_DN2355_c0_g1_i1.p1  ORF type:complete len:131 (+),score=20.77 TRINITY_DN2355_c0_g1_i1:528-920(+)